MANETAVDWLIEQLVDLDKQLDGRRKSDDSTVIKLNPTKIYEQAKQMEVDKSKADCDVARMQGWNKGYEDGYDEGFSKGYEEGYKDGRK